MERTVPKSIGFIESNGLRSVGVNLVFAADNHESFQASRNITRLFLRLSDRHNLQAVSFEDNISKIEIPPSSGATDRLKASFRGGLTTMRSTEVLFSYLSGLSDPKTADAHLSYSNMVCTTAMVIGRALAVIPSEHNDYLNALQWLNIKYLKLKGITHPEAVETQGQVLNDIWDRLDSLQDRLKQSFTDQRIKDVLGKGKEGLKIEDVYNMVRYMRNEDQLVILKDYLAEKEDHLGLMISGEAHKDDFVKVAQRLGIGYAIFTPYGINTKHPILRDAYRRRVREAVFGSGGIVRGNKNGTS